MRNGTISSYYTLKDAFGTLPNIVSPYGVGNSRFEPLNHRKKYYFTWNKTNYLQEPGLNLVVPKGMLYDDVPLNYQVKADSGAVAFTYQLMIRRFRCMQLVNCVSGCVENQLPIRRNIMWPA